MIAFIELTRVYLMHLAQKFRFHELRLPAGQPVPKKEILLPLVHLGL